MSSNDHNEWNDSLDFEALADEQEAGGFADLAPMPEDEPSVEAPLDQDYADAEEPLEEPAAEAMPAPERGRPRPPKRSRVSGTGMGFLFGFSTLVAAVGLAAAVVTALGIDPVSLWHPEGLLPWDKIIDFQTNPLNLLYLVGVGVVLLAMLGAGSVARAVRRVGTDASRDARLLDKLAALRIDDEKGWQDPLFKQHPTAAAFVNENVGAWRLAEARQRRSTGLEGELQRLLRAASSGSRDGLNDRFDNPTVGSLADELLRYHDERESAVQEAAAIRAKDREEAERLMTLLVEACSWTTAATDKLGVQGAAVDRVASSLRKLADSLGARGQEDPVARAAASVASLRGKLGTALRAPEPAGGVDLEDLVDRSNKLAFQIAMEVARLGPRGERLLPMTQALEELTTEFRRAADAAVGPVVADDAFTAADRTLAQVQTALEEASAGAETWRKTVGEAAPATAEAALQLTGLASGFNGQSERLNRAGDACALMTGLDFNPAAAAPIDPVEAPAPDLGFTRFDPFGGKGASPAEADLDGPVEADPFATDHAAEADPFAAGSVEDVPADDFGFGDESSSGPLQFDTPEAEIELTLDAAPEAASEAVAEADPFLADDEGPVYDLSGFGAVSAGDEDAAPAAPAAAAEEVLDLAAFGAVRLDEDAPAFAAPQDGGTEDRIHELMEFGAVPLD